mgnify:CR=1 FL=1
MHDQAASPRPFRFHRLIALGGAWILTSFASAAALPSAGVLVVSALRCEGRAAPLGVDAAPPRLGWLLSSPARGARQTAWHVRAATSPELLAREQADLWDSGRVESEATLDVPYAGKALASGQQVFWQVRTWDAAGRPSPWSAPSTWTMGVLADNDWHARWIGAPDAAAGPRPRRRRAIALRAGLRRATVNICGLGHYELSLNGRKVGDQLLAPGWTKYDRTCLYDTYDVTALLRPGDNAAGLLLGNGMYNVSPEASGTRYRKFTGSFGAPKVIAQLRLDYADGRTEFVGTDVAWRVTAGPLTFSNVFGGEDWDARREPAGWNAPGFDDSAWLAAAVVPGPGGALRGLSVAAPPIGAQEVLPSVKVTPVAGGREVYDFGQNAAAMPRLRVRGPAGSSVRLTPAELLHADGTVDRGSVGGGEAYWQYTLAGSAGDAPEAWFPKFFYQGYRYLQVELQPASPGGELPVIESLESVVVHANAAPVGEFSCSNELFNRIHTLIRWAQRSNLMSVLTDCPHREKLGWLEQTYLNGPSLRYEWDVSHVLAKALNDMADSQLASGLVPTIAPEYTVFKDRDTPPGGRGMFGDSPEWGSALEQVAWQQYLWSGDTAVLARHYDAMRRHVAYLATRRDAAGLVNYGLGDWYDIGPGKPGRAQLTPPALTATAIYYADLVVLEKTARLLGHGDDAEKFAGLAGETRAAFNRAFWHADSGTYATGSQTANAMPLALGLALPADAPRIVAAIAADISARGLTAGDIGYTYLLRALAAGGRSDVIFAMNNQADRPGYGWQLAHGATALTEAWSALSSSSQNHFMLGDLMEWFYRDLAGIGVDPAGPGFTQILIQPAIVGNVTWAQASYESVRGRIASAWQRDGRKLTLHVTIPANTTATVFIPAADPAVQEGGHPAAQSAGITLLRHENQRAVFTIASGDYTFTSTLPR